MPLNDVKVTLDANSAIDAMASLRDAIKENAAALGAFAIKMAETNAEGNVTKFVLDQMNDSAQKLTRTFKVVEGQLELVNTKITENARKQAEMLRNSQLAEAAARAQKLLSSRPDTALSGSLQDVPTAMIERLQRAQQSLTKVLAFSGIKDDEVNRVLDDLKNGIIKVESGPAAALQRSFLRILDTTRQINQTLAKTATSPTGAPTARPEAAAFLGTVQTQFPFPSGASTAGLAAYQAALARLQQTLSAGNIDFNQLSTIFKQLQTQPAAAAASFATLPPAMQAAQQAMTQFINTTKGVGDPGPVQRLLLNFDTVTRIIQTQILHRIVGAFTSAIQSSVQEAAKLEEKISEILTITQKDQGLGFEAIALKVRNLSDAFGKPQTDVAEAAYQAISNQVTTAAKSFDLVAEALRFSRIAVTSATDAVNLGSSAIQSFGLQGEDARQVYDQFFKTIELGRIRGQDLANTYGRVGPAAAAAGVSMAELNSLIATVSVKGVTPAETLTQISALFSALIKPSEELKKVFTDMGVTSGQQAVQVFGFKGVLDKLFEVLSTGPEKLAELLPNLRAIRAGFSAASDSGKSFEKNLGEIGNASKEASAALDLMGKSAGRQLLDKFEQIKNFLISDLGRDLVSFLNGLLDSFKGLTGAIPSLTIAFKALAVAMGTYLIVTKGSAIATAAWGLVVGVANASALLLTIGLATLTRQTVIAAVAIDALKAGMAGAGAAFGAAALLITGVTAVLFAFHSSNEERIQEFKTSSIALKEELLKQQKELNDKRIAANKDITDSFNKEHNESFKGISEFTAKARTVVGAMVEDIIEKNKKITAGLKIGFDTYFDSLRTRINNLKTDATKAQTAIQQSQKNIEDFAARSKERAFDTTLKFETDPTRQIQSVNNRIVELRGEISKLYAKGDDASVAAARTKTNQLEKLLEERASKEVEIRKKIVEAGKGGAFVTTETDTITGQLTQKIQVGDIVQRQIQEENNLRKKSAQYEQDLQDRKTEQIKTDEALIVKENQRLDALKQMAKQIEDFEKLPETKTLVEKGTAGIAEARKNLEKLKDDFVKLAGGELNNQALLRQTLADRVKGFAIQAELEITQNTIDQTQKQLQVQKDLSEKLFAELLRRKTELKRIQEESSIDALAFVEQGIKLAQVGTLEKTLGLRAPFVSPKEEVREQAAKEPAEKLIAKAQEAKALLESIRSGKLTGNELVDTIDKASIAIAEIGRLQIELAKIRRSDVGPTGKLFGETTQKSITDIIPKPGVFREQLKDVQKELQDARKAALGVSTTEEEFNKVEANIERLDSLLKEKYIKPLNEAKIAGRDFMSPATKGIADFAQEIGFATKFLDDLPGKLTSLSNQSVKINVEYITNQPPPAPLQELIPIPGKAEGGFLGSFAPRGTDTIPIMASPNEFIVNAASTKKFFSQLVSINSGFEPRYYAGGGQVTNVGDITVNSQIGGNQDINVRNFAKQLQREIRRGTVNFKI